MPSNEKNIFEHNVILVLPGRDQDGRRIVVLELGSKCIQIPTTTIHLMYVTVTDYIFAKSLDCTFGHFKA